jgi:ABC-2 type transport system permease protein
MNFINRFFLTIVLLPSALYERLGVNTYHLRSILNTKLIIDDRRPNTFQQARRKNAGSIKSSTLATMLLSAVMGTFFLFSFSVGTDYEMHLTIYFSMYIFMLASSLISDFTSVLIDIRDNYIILPKPVTDRTVVTARLLHIIIHVSKLVLPMSVPGFIFIAFKTGLWGAAVFFILLLFASLFTIFLINALYIFILKVTTPAKFQNVISYFQIIFTILIYASYQVLPRLVDKSTLTGFEISHNKFIWLAPSYWFAAAWQGLLNFHPRVHQTIAIAVSIVIPLASIYFVIKYFAPSFNQKLSLINSSNTEQSSVALSDKNIKSTTSGYVRTMAGFFSKQGPERMSFLFSWKMSSRSKDYKMKVYPSIGYIVVMLFMPLLRGDKFSISSLQNSDTAGTFVFVGIIYFSSFLLMMALSQMIFSDKYRAAWIYFTTPIKAPGELINGALKAALVKFYFPIVVLVSAAAIIITGPKLLPNLLLGICNEVLICSLIVYVTIKQLPFSVPQSNNAKAGSFLKGIFMLAIPAVVATLHFLIYRITPVVYIFIALSAVAIWYVQGSIKNISWKSILNKYEE